MRKWSLIKSVSAIAMSATIAIAPIGSVFAENADSKYHTYSSGDYLFEKVSHPGSSVETADGIVDYIGNGSIAPHIPGESANGNGDKGQSYSYASAVYGDWVYINTMYGGLGISNV